VFLSEYLVAIMLQAGRLKDLARVQMFLSREAVDQKILRDIIKRHKLDKQWASFQNRDHQ
jgi:hypothetical protein